MVKHYGIVVGLLLSICSVLPSEGPDLRRYIQVDPNSVLFAEMIDAGIIEGRISPSVDRHQIRLFVLRSDLDKLEDQARSAFQRQLFQQELSEHLERLDREVRQEVAQEQKIVLQDRALQSKQKKQQQKYYPKNNNRKDRSKHAQINMRVHQPKH